MFLDVKHFRKQGPYELMSCGQYKVKSGKSGWCDYENYTGIVFWRTPSGIVVNEIWFA